MSGLLGPGPQKPNPTPYVVLSVVLGIALLGVIGVVTVLALRDDLASTSQAEQAQTPSSSRKGSWATRCCPMATASRSVISDVTAARPACTAPT